jgi:hypothetical protein
MPHFIITQKYIGLETYHVEAPDSAAALKWFTHGKPGDPQYPGETASDEYLETLEIKVIPDGEE